MVSRSFKKRATYAVIASLFIVSLQTVLFFGYELKSSAFLLDDGASSVNVEERKPDIHRHALQVRNESFENISLASDRSPHTVVNVKHPSGKCFNTVQGPFLIADDKGEVCGYKDLNFESGCCPPSNSKFSCLGCDSKSKCCDSYEYCVSCCQNPTTTTLEMVHNSTTRTIVAKMIKSSVFKFCQDECRHSSLSVVHENTYISDFHHCYRRRKRLSKPLPVDASSIDGLTIVVARVGNSCDSACESAGSRHGELKCDQDGLAALNNCKMLGKYFSCKGSCVSSTGADQPAEVVDSAPRHILPGACLVNSKQELFSCAGSFMYTRRLCPCVPVQLPGH